MNIRLRIVKKKAYFFVIKQHDDGDGVKTNHTNERNLVLDLGEGGNGNIHMPLVDIGR